MCPLWLLAFSAHTHLLHSSHFFSLSLSSCRNGTGITPLRVPLISHISSSFHLFLRLIHTHPSFLFCCQSPFFYFFLLFIKFSFQATPAPAAIIQTGLSLMHHSWFCSLMHPGSLSQPHYQIFIISFYLVFQLSPSHSPTPS